MTLIDPPARLHLQVRAPVRPTPAGAFHAVARRQPDAAARFLRRLLANTTTPVLDEEAICAFAATDNLQEGLALVQSLQEDGLLEGLHEPDQLPAGALEEVVPALLASLSDEGQVLLADPDGLAVWSQGFEPGMADRLAALSADLGSLHERHAGTITEVVEQQAGAWALVDGIGASRLGCWPIHLGETTFVLVARGLPRMHHPNFTTLIWLLVHRYG